MVSFPKNHANTKKLNAKMSSNKKFSNINKNINKPTKKTCGYLKNFFSEIAMSGF